MERIDDMPEKSRIQKILAACGVASRRQAEELLRPGGDGKAAARRPGGRAVPGKDVGPEDGETVSFSGRTYYLALHKPRGFVTTMHDERDRRCVAQLVADLGERVYPVGPAG